MKYLIFIFLIACQQTYQPNIDVKEFNPSRGKELVLIANCQRCHGSNLGQDNLNITSDSTGIGDYSVREIINLIRNPGNENHKTYRWLSDNDSADIAGFLKKVKPVETFQKEKKEITDFGLGYVPEIRKSNTLEYGKYLVKNVAGCTNCHSQPDGWFSSGQDFVENEIEIDGEILFVPAIRGRGFKESQYLKLFGSKKLPNCTADNISSNDVDLIAMAQYLQTLK